MIESVRNHKYVLMNAIYNSSDIHDYIFKNTHSVSVVDTNKRMGIIENK